MDDILLIKLISGDELITRLEKDDKENITILNKPLALVMSPEGHMELHHEWMGGGEGSMNPHTFAKIRSEAIIVEIEPSESLKKRYKNLTE